MGLLIGAAGVVVVVVVVGVVVVRLVVGLGVFGTLAGVVFLRVGRVVGSCVVVVVRLLEVVVRLEVDCSVIGAALTVDSMSISHFAEAGQSHSFASAFQWRPPAQNCCLNSESTQR